MSHSITTAHTEIAPEDKPHIGFGSDAWRPKHGEVVDHQNHRKDLARKHTKSFALDKDAPNFKPAQDDRFGVNL